MGGGDTLHTQIIKEDKMKYKVTLIFIIIILFQIKCFAQDITLEKIVEYPTSGVYLEKDNLCVQDNYLFVASSYGLEIYEIEEDVPVQLVSRLPLRDDARTIEVKDNYAYIQSISYYEEHINLYKINIQDANNPYLVDSVYTEGEDGFGQGDIYNDFIILRNYDTIGNNYYSIYRIPELEFVQNYNCDNHFRKLNDSLAIYRHNSNTFKIYDFSDLENITEIGQVNLNDSGIYIENIKSVNDSIVACLGQEGIAFWKHSNEDYWQYITTIFSPLNEYWSDEIYVVENLMFLFCISNDLSLKSINISDIYNPYIVDTMLLSSYWICMSGSPIVGASNSVFIGSWQKIHQFVYDNGYFEEQYDIIDNYQQRGGVIYDDYLYVTYAYGLKIYDISSIPDITYINTLYEDIKTSTLILRDNFLFFVDFTNFAIIVLDITNPISPIVRNEIYIPTSNGKLLLGDIDDCIYYKEDYPDDRLFKYSIPEPNNYTLDFQYNLGCAGNGFIYNNHFYYLASGNPNGPDLKINSGLINNNPELVMSIQDFAAGYVDYPSSYIENCDSLFYLGSWEDARDSVKFYEIVEPTVINYKFTSHYRCDKSFFIDDNYLFTSGRFSHIYAYDLNIAYGLVEPAINYSDYGLSQYCVLHENNGQKYLYHFQNTAFSIYEIDDYGVDDEPELVNDPIICIPNPFSSSTTILYNSTTNLHELSLIKIYNVKGQLIKSLTSFPNPSLGMIEAVWDGRDESGKEVKSGVYFYKIGDDDGLVGKVVKLR